MSPSWSVHLRRSRRHLRQSPSRDDRGSTHIDPTFTGLTSSGRATANGTVSTPPNDVHPFTRRPFYALHADAYDRLITDPVQPWVDAVHARLTGAGRAPGAVLDAGCGTGRHAAALIAKGHRVDLADASAELLAQAAERCPSARRIHIDLCEMTTPWRYDAVTCRGVLNDMITDRDRASAIRSLAKSLKPGGLVFLDVREEQGSRLRADGVVRSRQVDLGGGATLTFTARTTWDQGRLHVEECYDLARPGKPAQRTTYPFVMRPWTEAELRALLHDAGLRDVEIAGGVGRRTPDRLFVIASAPAEEER